jgi:hypothetical protein
MISEYEKEFDKYRIFGDQRDFEIFKVSENREGENCVIPIYTPYMYPDVPDDAENKKELSPDCVKEAIEEFKRVLKRDGGKPILLARIDLTKPFDLNDLSNQAALPISSYYVLKEARRTDPKRARQMENLMFENQKIITDFREGRITRKQFDKLMIKQRKKIKNITE